MLSMGSFTVYNDVHYVYCSLFYFTEITDCAFVHYVFFFPVNNCLYLFCQWDNSYRT